MIWYTLGLLVLTWGINRLVLAFGFHGLNYSLITAEKDYEIGEEIPITSVVENNKLLTVSYLKIEEYFPTHFNVAKNVYSLFILPFQRVKRTYKVHAKKRGLHRIKDVVLELGDFAGFRSELRKVDVNHEIVVLPRRLDLTKSLAPMGPLGGDVSVRRWIIDDPLMTVGIREYTGQEPQRFIHWPSSAKHGNLMVKNFDFTSDNTVLVVLNVETAKPRWQAIEEDLVEKAVSITRGVLEEFQELNIPYGLITNAYNEQSGNWDYYYHAGLGQGHLAALLHVLGRIHFRVPAFFENTLRDIQRRQGNFTTVVIVTPRLLESYIEPIEQLAQAVPRTIVIAVEGEHLEALGEGIIKYRSKRDA